MRINLHLDAQPRPCPDLIKLWCTMLAEEYLVSVSHASHWMFSVENLEFVTEFLQSQGWKIHSYTTPAISMDRVVSYGFVVADDCDRFVAWRLAQQ